MAPSYRGKAAIVGVGEVPTGIYPDRPALASAVESAVQAMRDAGLRPGQIDAVLPAGAFFDPWYNTDLIFSRLAEELGLTGTAKLNAEMVAGGATSAALLKAAVGMVSSGIARTVLCIHSEKWGSAPTQEMIDKLATFGIPQEWEAPYGQCYNAVAGLITQRYMYETGTTAAQLASVVVALREWARINPNAMLREPTTVEQVLSSRMVADPVHSKECNRLADGGSAFVVADAETARRITDRPAWVLGLGGRVTHYALSQEPDVTRFGWREAAEDAFAAAGVEPKDCQVAELYDSYPVFCLIALEELGFCRRGEAGAFVAAGNTRPGGRLPMTTNGGMLAQGHTATGGGVAILVEAARQVMGKAGARQVPDIRFVAETSVGGTYMDAQVSVLGREVA